MNKPQDVKMDTVISESENVKPTFDMTAGEMLRTARTTGRRKRELQTIAKLLCIREDFLQALEDGNYNVLPEVVYILGFARNYAMELGLDPDVVVAKIKQELGLVNECRTTVDDGVRGGKHAESNSCKSNQCAKLKSMVNMSEIVPMLKKWWAFIVQNWKWSVGVACSLLALVILLLVFSGTSSVDTVANQDDSAVIATDPTEPAYTQPVRERFGIENRDKSTIILQANKNAGDVGTWVQIEDSRGKKAFSKIMFPGDIFYMPNGNGYKGTFGNVAGIDFWVGGKLAPTVKADRNARIAIAPENLIKSTAGQQ